MLLLDQIQAVDITRLRRSFGVIPPVLLEAVRKALVTLLRLVVAN